MLYLIAPTSRTVAKLGYSKNPQQRLKQLQTGHSAPLELLATRRGTMADEAKFHQWLSPDRTSGEWFKWSDKIEQILTNWR
jgi:Meiotically up-regulated gene 113